MRVRLPDVPQRPGRKTRKVQEHHFAHAKGAECAHSVETALHLAAKDILAKRREIVLPAVEIHFPYSSRHIAVAPERRYLIEAIEVERKLQSIIPDVIVKIGGRRLLVEVTVTHGVGREKLRKIRELGLSCVEIDLSDADRNLAREEIEKFVVDENSRKRLAAQRARRRRAQETVVPSDAPSFRISGTRATGGQMPDPGKDLEGKPYANVNRRLHGMRAHAHTRRRRSSLRRVPHAGQTTATGNGGSAPATAGVRAFGGGRSNESGRALARSEDAGRTTA